MIDLDALTQLQEERGLTDVHLVEFADEGFAIAHTDDEREHADILSCPLHRWLEYLNAPPESPGVYVVRQREVDGYSESYPYSPWEFQLLAPPAIEPKKEEGKS